MLMLDRTFLQHVAPNFCLLCKYPTHSALALCEFCIERLPWNTGPCCQQCALPLPGTTVCGACLKDPPPFCAVISPFHYEPPIDRFMYQLKFSNQLIYAYLMGHLLARRITTTAVDLPEAILPVPLHRQRLRERGFNQALEIAKPLANQLKIRCCKNLIIRSKATLAQAQLTAHERNDNVKNAFQIRQKIPFSHIAIVDDVMTTEPH